MCLLKYSLLCLLCDHRYGMSALMYAAREGRATIVQKLIEDNAAINTQDSKGNSVSNAL